MTYHIYHIPYHKPVKFYFKIFAKLRIFYSQLLNIKTTGGYSNRIHKL